MDSQTILNQRAEHFRHLSRWMRGETDRHPSGASGLNRLTYDDKGCWDTHPRAYQFSEWAGYA